MKYAKLMNYDTANGPGLRTTLFVQGCPHHCKGCFNPGTWDFNGGMPFTDEVKKEFFVMGSKPGIKGFSILGGEPLAQGSEMFDLIVELNIYFPDKDIWMWTGSLYEELDAEQRTIIKGIDVLVDGPFIEEEKDIRLVNRGSKNQRIIDVKKTLETGTVTLWRNPYAK